MSEIMYVEHIDEGLKITGTVSVVSGEVDIDIDPTKHVVPESGIQIRLSVTDDGRGDNETYLQIVRSCNINCTGSIITQNNGKTAKPRVIDRTRSGYGAVSGGLVILKFKDIVPSNTVRVCTGWKCSFDVVIGKVDSNKNVKVPNSVHCMVVSAEIGNFVPAVSDFVRFSSSEDPMDYDGVNLRIMTADLADLSGRLTDTLHIGNLSIETHTDSLSANYTTDIVIGEKLCITGFVIVDLGQVTWRDGAKNANAPDAETNTLCPNITISGANVMEDIVFVGGSTAQRVTPRMHRFRVCDHGSFHGFCRTIYEKIQIFYLEIIDGSFVGRETLITVGGDTYTNRTKRGAVTTGDVNSNVIIADSYVGWSLNITTLHILAINGSEIQGINATINSATNTALLRVFFIESKASNIELDVTNAKAVTATDTSVITFENSTVSSLTITGLVSTKVPLVSLVDFEAYGTVDIRAATTVAATTKADVVIMSGAGGRTRIDTMPFNTNLEYIISGQVSFGTMQNASTAISVNVFSANIDITSCYMNSIGTFPMEFSDESIVKIGTCRMIQPSDTAPLTEITFRDTGATTGTVLTDKPRIFVQRLVLPNDVDTLNLTGCAVQYMQGTSVANGAITRSFLGGLGHPDGANTTISAKNVALYALAKAKSAQTALTAANIASLTSKVDAKLTAAINAAGEAAIAARIVANTTAGKNVSDKATEAETAATNANNYVGESSKTVTEVGTEITNAITATNEAVEAAAKIANAAAAVISQANIGDTYTATYTATAIAAIITAISSAITTLATQMGTSGGIGSTVNALATAASTDFAGLTGIIKNARTAVGYTKGSAGLPAGFTVINSTLKLSTPIGVLKYDHTSQLYVANGSDIILDPADPNPFKDIIITDNAGNAPVTIVAKCEQSAINGTYVINQSNGLVKVNLTTKRIATDTTFSIRPEVMRAITANVFLGAIPRLHLGYMPVTAPAP